MARVDYDRMSASYDQGRALALDGLGAWRDRLAADLPPPGGLPVLDVGSGTGQFATAFVEWFGCPVIGVEPSAGMRAQARATPGGRRIHYVGGHAEHLPIRDGSCGAAWLSTVIHHFTGLHAAAREVRRVLVPGAPVLIRSAFPGRTDLIRLYDFFPGAKRVIATFPSVEETVAAFEAAGFSYESFESIPQLTARSLRAYRDRAARRADTTLMGISDAEFDAGLAALDRAVASEPDDQPVISRLDLLVLR
jgi:SAM-dependent methyltransferase